MDSKTSHPTAKHGRRNFIKQIASIAALYGVGLSVAGQHLLADKPTVGKLPNNVEEFSSGLQFPEGPVALKDGSLIVCETAGGRLTRIRPDGKKQVIAELGGGPNGAAIGPDGAVYVCNNGGGEWVEIDGLLYPSGPATDYTGGRIERVDLITGKAEVLYRNHNGHNLSAPNDLVFDANGGFWFTDTGRSRARNRDHGGLYYARSDGSFIREAAYPMLSPNGIGLSPDGKQLYVADLMEGSLLSFQIVEEGKLAPTQQGPMPGNLIFRLAGRLFVDGLAVEESGAICVATPLNGGITCVSPNGAVIDRVELPFTLTTNICFGGADRKTAYITLGGTERESTSNIRAKT